MSAKPAKADAEAIRRLVTAVMHLGLVGVRGKFELRDKNGLAISAYVRDIQALELPTVVLPEGAYRIKLRAAGWLPRELERFIPTPERLGQLAEKFQRSEG